MADVLGDSKELGRRIAAARGYLGANMEAFAQMIGVTEPTLRAYERGALGQYASSREQRRALAEKVATASGAPRDLLGLEAKAVEEAVAESLQRQVDDLRNDLDLLATQLSEAVGEALAGQASVHTLRDQDADESADARD
jgi:transcriptional regulator with XRE-family HTH domain